MGTDAADKPATLVAVIEQMLLARGRDLAILFETGALPILGLPFCLRAMLVLF